MPPFACTWIYLPTNQQSARRAADGLKTVRVISVALCGYCLKQMQELCVTYHARFYCVRLYYLKECSTNHQFVYCTPLVLLLLLIANVLELIFPFFSPFLYVYLSPSFFVFTNLASGFSKCVALCFFRILLSRGNFTVASAAVLSGLDSLSCGNNGSLGDLLACDN